MDVRKMLKGLLSPSLVSPVRGPFSYELPHE